MYNSVVVAGSDQSQAPPSPKPRFCATTPSLAFALFNVRTAIPSSFASASVVRHTDGTLFRLRCALLTFSRMSAALAVQM
jgi:hypothetical protein